MDQLLRDIVNFSKYPLADQNFRLECQSTLEDRGVLIMSDFLTPGAIGAIQNDGEKNQHLAYYTANNHNIYLKPADPEFTADHPRNREIISSKGCITTDQLPQKSMLHQLYDAQSFRAFLCAVLNEHHLYEYADPLSSINIHYASKGQELGWHFDNSSFAITLLIQEPEGGGLFQYVQDIRDADSGEMNYELAGQVLDGTVEPNTLSMHVGALVLFRGRNSMHRVTPTQGDRTRMLVVFAYNTEPSISLSKSAQMTFYGRVG